MRKFFVLLLFIVLTVGFTWPAALHMRTASVDHGDPILNAWILGWDVHQIFNNPLKLFEANIFYPYPHTLAYSEHLLASSLVAMPFILIWKNAILGLNVVFLFSFVFSGWGMYLLIRELSENVFSPGSFPGHHAEIAGVVGGIIFAFCPFRFGHLCHLQLLTIQWFPFTFLYFHRFIRTNRFRDLFLFTLFFLLLCFSCLYYACYASIALFIAFLFFVRGRHVPKILLFIFLSAAAIFPVARIYSGIQKEMDFKRSTREVRLYSAKLRNYFAVPPNNVLYRKVLRRFSGGGEKELFPGAAAIILAVYGFIGIRRICCRGGACLHPGRLPWATTGGRPYAKRKFLTERFKTVPYKHASPGRIKWFYFTFLIVFLLLSLGTYFDLYRFLYSHLPGFKGLRVPARFAIMVVFALSVFAGFGVLRIKKWKTFFFILIPLLLVLEYWSGTLNFFQKEQEVPEVYKWLAEEDDNTVIVELPIAPSVPTVHFEAYYMYSSTYHWKKMVNGYSGFFPPSYWDMNKTLQNFPSKKSIALLREMGVKYAIIHEEAFGWERWRGMKDGLSRLKHVLSFGKDHVYEL